MKFIIVLTVACIVTATLLSAGVGAVVSSLEDKRQAVKKRASMQIAPPTMCIDGVVYFASHLMGNGYISAKFNRDGTVEVCYE